MPHSTGCIEAFEVRCGKLIYDAAMGISDQAVFINGTVGTGKTTVALALGALLREAGLAHAVIDLDEIRRAWPARPGDRFNSKLELVNLGSLIRNYGAAGIGVFVLAGVLEDSKDLPLYRRAVRGLPLTVVRITAGEPVRRERLRARHAGDGTALRWHLQRSVELDAVLDRLKVDDLTVDSSSAGPRAVARTIFEFLEGSAG